jgi:hypothetical protein
MSLAENHSVVIFGSEALVRGHRYRLTLTASGHPVVQVEFRVAGTSPAPSVARVNPTSVRARGGTVVTITGSSLSGASAVTFGGVSGRILSTSATRLVVVAPAHVRGLAAVRVRTATGTSTAGTPARVTYR